MNELSSAEKIRYPNRWQKGTSGNYRGRPKVDIKIRELAKVHTEEAICKLVEIATDSSRSCAAQFCATVALLNAGWNTRLMGHLLKGKKMTVWQYLYTLEPHRIRKEENAA